MASTILGSDGQPGSAIDAATAGADVEGLVRDTQKGDEQAFNRLVAMFGKPMYNLAYRMTGNAADADDLAQEIFVKLFRSIRSFQGKSKFSTWLYALAANTCRSGLRRIRRIEHHESMSLDDPEQDGIRRAQPADPAGCLDGAAERADVQAQVEAAIAALPEEFRMTIILRDLQGLAYEEIAEAMHCEVGTVKSRLARARLRVKDRLVRQGVVPGGGQRAVGSEQEQ